MTAITYSTGETCYAAVPGRAAVEPEVIVDPQLGWNSTARSTDTIAAGNDGYVEFEAAPAPAQIVAGFGLASVGGTNTNPWLCTHAFYITSSAISIYEPSGGIMPLTTFSDLATPQDGRIYRIQRESGVVTYWLDDILVYTSAAASLDEVYLDVSLYRAGDYVENPIVSDNAALEVYTGRIVSELPPIDTVFWGKTYAVATPAPNPAPYPYDFASDLIGGQIGRSDSPLDLPAVTTDITLSNRIRIDVTIPPIDAIWGNRYAQFSGELPVITASLAGTATDYSHTGWFVPQLPPFIGYMHGWAAYPISIGEDGGDPAYLPPLDVIFSGRTYAVDTPAPNPSPYKYAMIGDASDAVELPIHFVSYFDDGFPDGWMYYEAFDILAFREYYDLGSILVASLAEGLNLTDAFTLYYFHDADLEEGVDLTDTYTLADILHQLMKEGVTFSNALPQQDLDTIQYAVNAATGALTTYRNFGFTAFWRLGDTTYAVRPGGVYRLRSGDDAGAVANGMIDFGDTDFGTAERKNVDSMYLGMSNDGAVFARLTDDNGGEHYYQVVQTQPTARVIAGRGVMARRYGLRLEIVDVSNFELDNIEFSVGVSVRRRMP